MTEPRHNDTLWSRLTGWTLLSLEGPQALTFLQGQVTCDLREALSNQSLLGAHCNPKGRMIFSFRALADSEEQLRLRVRTDMQALVQRSLGKYIVFSKAQLRALDSVALRGFNGPQARAQLSEQLTAPAPETGQWVQQGEDRILTLGPDRFECWLTPERAEALDQAFSHYATDAGDNRWQLEDMRAGIGEVTPETSEMFTPQALNLPQLGGVSFRKGCYTGQEVVARLHYKGKLKRFMQRLIIDGVPALTPAQTLYNGEGKKIAELVQYARNEGGQSECLVVMDDNPLQSVELAGIRFGAQLLPLPYALSD